LPGWKEVNIKKILEKKLGLLVFVNNDVMIEDHGTITHNPFCGIPVLVISRTDRISVLEDKHGLVKLLKTLGVAI
jgi:hypothetical protein